MRISHFATWRALNGHSCCQIPFSRLVEIKIQPRTLLESSCSLGERGTNTNKHLAPLVHTLGSISAALSCLVYPPSGQERGLLSRTAAGNRAYPHTEFTETFNFCRTHSCLVNARGFSVMSQRNSAEGPPRKASYPYDFLKVIMASDIARGRARTTTTMESRKMTIFRDIASLFDIVHSCYDQLTAVKTRFPLASIT